MKNKCPSLSYFVAKASVVSDVDYKKAIAASQAVAGGVDEIQQPDLLYMKDVLVSVGENLNEDIFLPDELIKAVIEKKSVNLKPVNWEHDEKDNIGVMYDSYIADKSGNRVQEDAVAGLADFDVVSYSAIWKTIYPERALAIMEGHQNDSLFVSMEAYFNDYDYAVGNDVVQRNGSTAFLDRALKANGGSGFYQGQRVRRVLRDIVFGGKGIVKKPANPDSYILDAQAKQSENVTKNEENFEIDAKYVIGSVNLLVGDKMNEKIEQLEKALAETKTQLETIVKEKEVLSKEKDTLSASIKELETSKAKICDLEKQHKDNCEKIAQLEQMIVEKDTATKQKDSELAEIKAQAEKLTKKIEEKELADKLVARKLEVEKTVSNDSSKVEAILKRVTKMTDEEFKAEIEYLKLFAPVVTASDKTANQPSVNDVLDALKAKAGAVVPGDSQPDSNAKAAVQSLFGK